MDEGTKGREESGLSEKQDYSSEPVSISEAPVIKERPYNRTQEMDKTKKWMAFGLLGATFVVAIILIIVVACSPTRIDAVLKVVQIIFPALIGLSSSVTAYYFASKPAKDKI